MALDENKDCIVLMDSNLDSSDNKYISDNFTTKYKLQKHQDARLKFLIKNNVIIHNKDSTYFQNSIETCIDHIYSNCPTKIYNMTTRRIGTSDHALLSVTYNTKKAISKPQYIMTRPSHLLTKHSLTQHFENNYNINDIFQSNDAKKRIHVYYIKQTSVSSIVGNQIVG